MGDFDLADFYNKLKDNSFVVFPVSVALVFASSNRSLKQTCTLRCVPDLQHAGTQK